MSNPLHGEDDRQDTFSNILARENNASFDPFVASFCFRRDPRVPVG